MKKAENLLIDCSFLDKSWTQIGSHGLYTTRLIQGFLKYGHYHVHVLVWREQEDLIDKFVGQEYDKIVIDREKQFITSRSFYRLFGYLPSQLKKELKRREITTILTPNSLYSFLYFSKSYRHYAVVHDLFLYNNMRKRRGRISYFIWRQYRSMMIRKYPHVISISKVTHDELLRIAGKKSYIAYNSIPFDFKIQERAVEMVCGKKYILDINRFEQYKNAEVLIRALNLLKNDISHVLYLKGSLEHEEDRKCLEKIVVELGLENRVIFDVNFRTEGELHYLYTHADLFVSPSLREGFGWTPIEAAIHKTPVLVSNIDVLQEITCGKVPTFDPHSPEDLANHILEILNNPPSEQERSELAEFFLDKYSLENQIMRLEEIFES